MKSLFAPILFFFSIICFSSCVIQGGGSGLYIGDKDECGFALNQLTGRGVRWKKGKFPIRFYIHESVPPEAQANFKSAVIHWNIVWEEFLLERGLEAFLLFEVLDGELYSGAPASDSRNILFFEAENFAKITQSDNPAEIQAITAMVSNRKGMITDTDIIVNSRDYRLFYDRKYYNQDIAAYSKQYQSNRRRIASSRSMGFWSRIQQKIKMWVSFLLKPFKKKKPLRQIARESGISIPSDHVDYASLIIHEMGHVPGLAHFDESDEAAILASRGGSFRDESFSVMEPRLESGRIRRNISEYDLSQLFCGYFPEYAD